jgi:hypothetical protein
MVNYLPHWPNDNQDVVNGMSGDHWFVSNYHHLRRTPTRAELFYPYIPADILEDRPIDMDPRLREALEYLIQEAEDEAILMANDEGAADNAESADESTDMDIDPEDEEMSVIVLSDDEHDEDRYLVDKLNDAVIAEVHHIMREASLEDAEEEKEVSVNDNVGQTIQQSDIPCCCTAGHDSHTALHVAGATSVPVAAVPAVPTTWPSVPVLPQARTNHEAGPEQVYGSQPRNLVPIVMPQDSNSRRRLAVSYHDEILQDWVQDTLSQNGFPHTNLTGDDIHSMEIEDAINNCGRVHGLPYLLVDHFVRHDWHAGTGDCLYTVQTPVGRHRAPAEGLEERFSGVRYAVWSYWGMRGNVRRSNIQRYITTFGLNSFYSTLMWPWLEDEIWLALWRNRRDSRRV